MAINKTVNKSTSSHGAMRNCIEYVLKDEKIKDAFVEITGPYEEETIDYDKVYNSFLDEKRLWGKDSGRMYAHNIISFHKDENISPEEAFDFGREFAEKWFPDYQTLICVHQDRDHIHIHLVTNTVSFKDGRKHITFINDKGQKVRDSNLEKTFNIQVSKEALNGKFIGKDERSRADTILTRGDTKPKGRESLVQGTNSKTPSLREQLKQHERESRALAGQATPSRNQAHSREAVRSRLDESEEIRTL